MAKTILLLKIQRPCLSHNGYDHTFGEVWTRGRNKTLVGRIQTTFGSENDGWEFRAYVDINLPIWKKEIEEFVTQANRERPEPKKHLREQEEKIKTVEIMYGIHPVPEESMEDGYAYRDPGLDLKLGDLVELPPNWLSNTIGSTNIGTVISLTSKYDGIPSTVRRVVLRASERKK